MNTTEALQDFYQVKIAPVNARFRAIKRRAWKLSQGTLWGTFLAGAVIIIILKIMNPGEKTPDLLTMLGVVLAVSVVFALCVLFYQLSRRKQIFKHEVVPAIVHIVDSELKYSPDQYINTDCYYDSQLYRSYDRCSGGDLIHGKYHGVELSFSEFESEYKTTDSKGHTTWHSIFKGIFFIADFNKDFKGLTLVVPDIAEKLLGRSIGSFFQKCNITQPGKLVRLENVDFEKNFAVYSSDDIEARYILSPGLMERILALKKRYDDANIALSFRSSLVYIGIPTRKNFFEYKGGELTFQAVQQIYDDVMKFTSIIDELNLTLRIWTKE